MRKLLTKGQTYPHKDGCKCFRCIGTAWNKGMKGLHLSPETEFKKGKHPSPETEIKIGQRLSPKTEFKKGLIPWSKLNSNYQDGEKHWNWQGGKPKCVGCGEQLGSYNAKKCNSCASKTRVGQDNVKCYLCEKTFHLKPFAIKRSEHQFCSRKCMAIFKSENMVGENSPSWRGGRPKCDKCGRQLVSYRANLCKLCHLESQFKSKKPTSIEKVIYDYLTLKGIAFEKQKQINGKFIVDAYIPNLNLIIEADGEYWHGLEKTIKKDRAENAYLIKCGFDLLRLSEVEINNGNFTERMVF